MIWEVMAPVAVYLLLECVATIACPYGRPSVQQL